MFEIFICLEFSKYHQDNFGISVNMKDDNTKMEPFCKYRGHVI